MKIKEIRELSSEELVQPQARTCARKVSTCACSSKAARWNAPAGSSDIRREVARIETILSEKTQEQAARRRRSQGLSLILVMSEETSQLRNRPTPRRPKQPAALSRRPPRTRRLRKTRVGVVVSNKMAEDRRGRDRHARAASQVPQDRQAIQEVLRARRREQGAGGRSRPHHGNPPPEQAQAVALWWKSSSTDRNGLQARCSELFSQTQFVHL